MRLGLVAAGLVVLFAGLLLLSVSRSAETINDENREIVKIGARDAYEVTDVNLNTSDKFAVRYSGGGRYVSPDEVVVIVFDPYGNVTSVSYVTQFQNGIIANYTGAYRVQVGAPGLIDPSSPLIITIDKIVETTRLEYPYFNLLPLGLAAIIAGVPITVFGAISSRRKIRNRRKVRQRNLM